MSFPPPEKSIFAELASDNLLKMEDGLMKLMSEQKEVPFYDKVIKLHMDEIKSLRNRNAEMEAEVGRLREALALASSMIRSGEGMSRQAEREVKQALSQKAGDLKGGGGE